MKRALCLAKILFTALPLALAACSSAPKATVSPHFSRERPRLIAVLPLRNESGSAFNVPSTSLLRVFFDKKEPLELTREFIAYKVGERGYKVQELETTDAILDRYKNPLAADEREVAQALGVEAVLVTNVKDFNPDLLVSKHKLLVDFEFQLISRETGEILWQGENPEKIVWVNAPSAGVNYRAHLQKITDQTFSSLPRAQ